MDRLRDLWKKYKIWWIALFVLNVLFGVLLWLTAAAAFGALFVGMILGSALVYVLIAAVLYSRDKKREQEFLTFLETPELWQQEQYFHSITKGEQQIVQVVQELLCTQQADIKNNRISQEEYQEYIEAWAHEIKTPLALMTFVLDNRRGEMSPLVSARLEYARTKMQEDLDRMLCYARLQSSRRDYFFEFLSVRDLWDEVIEEYEGLLQEQKIKIKGPAQDYMIYTDKKGFLFILRQAVGNAIKYQDKQKGESFLVCSVQKDSKQGIQVLIRDNGVGVPEYDLPFLMEKSFTGDAGEKNKNATGMGLYLAKRLADFLSMDIKVSSVLGEGFEVVLWVPELEQ